MESSGMMPMAKEALHFFMFTMVELAVLFIGISALIGLFQDLLPQEKVKRWMSGRKGRGYLLGSLLGGLTPFCSCSTIPMTLGLLKVGAGFGPTMAFLFTSPLVNPIIIPLFLTMLGVKITVVYGVVSVSMAIGISFLLDKFGFFKYVRQEMTGLSGAVQTTINIMPAAAPASAPEPCCATPQPQQLSQLQPLMAGAGAGAGGSEQGCCGSETIKEEPAKPSRWKRVTKEAVKQYRTMFPFIVIGVSIGAIIHGFMPADFVAQLAGADNPLAIPVAAVVGIPLYIRVSTMIPIAVSLIAKGMSYGAVVALTIGGAGASLPEVTMLKGVFKLPLLAAFVASVMLIAVTTGLLVNLVI